ncbi:hypothetical protein AVEN_265482-1 [Araneus ventricosus]|uniref:Uncharacterized protein n=1 Tax=Araneus ventricosus TaxID=182803 RepID=A0A4Y2CHM3_ARAVE|nr:hypothetical protein AVEN_265482-1 [Araneus ventricosus]
MSAFEVLQVAQIHQSVYSTCRLAFRRCSECSMSEKKKLPIHRKPQCDGMMSGRLVIVRSMGDLTRKGETQQCRALMKLRVQWTASTLLDEGLCGRDFSLSPDCTRDEGVGEQRRGGAEQHRDDFARHGHH